MSGLPIWSPDALQGLRRLHRCDWLIYVEGQDDVAFWRAVLEQCGIASFKIKVAGNDKTLLRYASAIVDSGIESLVVAGDRDYRPWVEEEITHPRIMYTVGYSAENTLFNAAVVTRVIEDLGGVQGLEEAEFQDWLTRMCEGCKKLVVLDLADRLSDSGIGPLGRSCARFLTDALNVRGSQVEAVSEPAESKIPAAAIRKARKLIEDDPRDLALIIRGHFLSHAVLRYVRKAAESYCQGKVPISNSGLRALLVARLPHGWSSQSEFTALEARVRRAFSPHAA